jgi:uncharacterized 2Fe-2S/4Fe-4S cluster protein (DUF4445 family)
MFPIRFLPDDRTYQAEQPSDLMLAAAAADIWVEQPCGSKTVCGKCRVRVREGDAPVSAADERLLTPEERNDGWRLGCQLRLSAASVIEIPPATRSVALKPFGPPGLFTPGFDPNIVKRYVELRPPDEQNQFASFDLISRALGSGRLRAEMSVVQNAVQRLVESDYKVSVIVAGDELLGIEAGDTAGRSYGVAIDIGSTTLAAALVHLADGTVLSAVSRLNPQVRFGADIISRIHHAQEHRGGSEQLHTLLVSALRQMIEELAAQSAVSPSEIYSIVCAGNATMTHCAAGAEITPLGQAPYVGLWTREWTVPARALDFPVSKRAVVRFMPMIRSHVGGDTISGMLACALDQGDAWQAMIDLGTNSEVVVGNRHRMVATSTAAGPAFEGANIHMGMRAAPGAIDQVRISPDGRIVCKTVNNEPARGLCGTGLVDAAAELVRVGVIAPSGYMKKGEELSGLPEALRARCIVLPDGQAAVVLSGWPTLAGVARVGDVPPQVVITAQDVRQLQLIKASIYAGLEILLRHLGIGLDQLERVNIAGAFGNFLRKDTAQAIGLVPSIDPEKIQFIGNAAGVGARMALVDASARERANRISEVCEYVELAGHPDYQDTFVAAIPFPELTPARSTADF